MKKLIAIAALSLLFLDLSFAQIPITGSWFKKMTVMGTTVSDTISFDNDSKGQATNKFFIDFKMNILGIKASGQAEMNFTGTFVAEGKNLTINWDTESVSLTRTPMTVTYMGETMDDGDEKEFDEMMDELVGEIKTELEKNPVDEYYNVSVKGDKLILMSKDENGKQETDKFSRVK